MEKGVIENEEKLEDIFKRYKKKKYGIISKIYSTNEESKVYQYAAEILYKKYGHIISKEKIFDVISKRGHIFTMILKNREAFYEVKTGNIGIQHFLNKFTEGLLHEIVHKLGFEQADNSFKEMSTIFKEAGTEIVAAETLSNNEDGRELIFQDIWAKYPEKVDSNFLSVCIVNQINLAIGNENLEKSILKGKDYFKPAIIERWGESTYVFLKENIEDLSRIENRFWRDYEFLSEEERERITDDMKKRIDLIQNTILETEFDKRMSSIFSKTESKKFLKDLLTFEENRIRIKSDLSGKIKFIDVGFEAYFNRCKENLETRFGILNILYNENSWQEKYKKKEILYEITDEEKKEIALLAIEFKRKYKKKSHFTKVIESIFGKKQEMLEENNSTFNKRLEMYKVDINFESNESNEKNIERQCKKNNKERLR